MTEEKRSVYWEDGKVWMIDQTVIPHEFRMQAYDDYGDVADAIRTMVVRGAPAIGAAAAFGMVLAAHQSKAAALTNLRTELQAANDVLAQSRPTAVNLFWALRRMMRVVNEPSVESVDAMRERLLHEAQAIADEDIATNQQIGANGAALVPQDATVIHHCNTGSLATVGWGTALGVIRSAHFAGKKLHVLVDETRPRLQGARLTSWELQNVGIDHSIIADGASGHYLRRGGVDLCVVGADRIAANGDTANKIGTYNLAVVAHENGVPFYVAAPFSTIDMSLEHGDLIEIEERDEAEVTVIRGQRIAPEGARAKNPAFDVTPHQYITAIITEHGVIYPPFDDNLKQLAQQLGEAV